MPAIIRLESCQTSNEFCLNDRSSVGITLTNQKANWHKTCRDKCQVNSTSRMDGNRWTGALIQAEVVYSW